MANTIPTPMPIMENASSVNIRDREAELEVALREHRSLDAAHLCADLGRHAESGALFEKARAFWEASAAFRRAGDLQRALKTVVRLSSEDPRYPEAARAAIELAVAQQLVSFDLEQFLAPYLTRPIQAEVDADMLLRLAQLFEQMSYLPQALDILRSVLAFAPQNVLAKQMLRGAERKARNTSTREVELDRHDVRAVRELLRTEEPLTRDPPDAPRTPKKP